MRLAPRWSIVVVGGVLLGATGAVALVRLFPPSNGESAPPSPPGMSSGLDVASDASAGAPSAGRPAVSMAEDAGAGAEADAGPDVEPKTLAEQRERLYTVLAGAGATPEEVASVRAIFEASPYLGQGNPDVSVHPMSRAECRERRSLARIAPDDPALCGERYMVPVTGSADGEAREAAKVCIDQYEFPGVPCEYPVVNVQANEAAALCSALGKRLCDAHEWEGACAGAVRAPEAEYLFNHDRRYSSGMHNLEREIVWAYGSKKNHRLCATTSFRTKGCPGGGWKQCGSNTFPTGAFPECKSPFGVYDQHGNAAEHMNLPTKPEELMSRGTKGGVTEMKGSWFIFASGEPHLDDCRWREPSWHESKVMDPGSHRNYHLGFRCCKSL